MATSTGARGQARSRGPSVQQLLDADSRQVPKALRDHAYAYQGSLDFPRTRYTSPEFAALEARYVWPRTWQMACHEDHIKAPGQHVVYDVADESLIVTRTPSGEIRAFHNSCLHRGTKLRVEDGQVGAFRCPFHGWTWDLDGELSDQPCSWDFSRLREDPDNLPLPQARVATWGGFVFVNQDPDCEPFESYAGKLIDHWREFPMERRYIAFHAVKEVPANWKVVMEAFSEAYHVIATHPQILEFCADANSEYSVWDDAPYVSRFINAFGEQSPHLDELSDQAVVDAYLAFFTGGRASGEGLLAEGLHARHAVADVFRANMSQHYRADLSQVSDCEALDAILYHLFPAFAPWAGIGQPLVYRWRPGRTPDTCFMDVLRMAPVPDGEPRPDPAPCSRLTLEQPWKEAPDMGGLADVFEQDMSNLPRVQAGLKSTGKPGVSFGEYQEARLRMVHRNLDRFIAAGLEGDGRSPAELAPFRVPED